MAYGSLTFGSFGLKTNEDFIVSEDGTLMLNKLSPYPIGSIYQSIDSTSPAELFGGTWERIASNRVLMGASEEHLADSTAEAGLPNIIGTSTVRPYSNNAYTGVIADAWDAFAISKGGASWNENGSSYSSTGKADVFSFNASRYSSIYGNSTTVQPPAYYIYIWKRIQ